MSQRSEPAPTETAPEPEPATPATPATPEPAAAEPPSRRSARRQALTVLVRAFPGRTAVLAAIVVIAGALPAAFSLLVGRLVDTIPGAVDTGLGSAAGHTIIVTLAAIGAVLLTQEVMAAVGEIASSNLYRRFDEYLLSRVMGTTLTVPGLDLFEDPDLAARRDRAVRIARYGPGELVSGLHNKWTAQAGGLAATGLVASYRPILAVTLGALWVVIARQLQTNSYRDNPYWAEPLRRAAYLKQIALMPEWAKELRIFGLTDWLADRFGRQWGQVMHELWRVRRIGRTRMTVLLAAVLVANLVAGLVVARSALTGDLGLGSVAVLVQGLVGMAGLASQRGDIWIENGAVPVPDVLALERAVVGRLPDRSETAPPEPVRLHGEIRYQDVHFSYPGGRSVFRGLDLTIHAGRSLAVVGLNGAGKTTLIKLLTGLVQPQRGTISVDGADLRSIDSRGWQRGIGAIFADFVHYPLPVRDNVGFGAIDGIRPADRDQQVRTALARAGADSFVTELPGGLDTPLTRRYRGGIDLSGGQWQRIALARALLAVSAGARILVLDEPTAQLDVRAEADLYQRFLDLTAGLTTIVISHRFSTVRRADRIVVLESGEVVEDGTHDELVSNGGRYARMFAQQAMRYGEPAPDGGGRDD